MYVNTHTHLYDRRTVHECNNIRVAFRIQWVSVKMELTLPSPCCSLVVGTVTHTVVNCATLQLRNVGFVGGRASSSSVLLIQRSHRDWISSEISVICDSLFASYISICLSVLKACDPADISWIIDTKNHQSEMYAQLIMDINRILW